MLAHPDGDSAAQDARPRTTAPVTAHVAIAALLAVVVVAAIAWSRRPGDPPR